MSLLTQLYTVSAAAAYMDGTCVLDVTAKRGFFLTADQW